jgi:hypothetical protein
MKKGEQASHTKRSIRAMLTLQAILRPLSIPTGYTYTIGWMEKYGTLMKNLEMQMEVRDHLAVSSSVGFSYVSHMAEHILNTKDSRWISPYQSQDRYGMHEKVE